MKVGKSIKVADSKELTQVIEFGNVATWEEGTASENDNCPLPTVIRTKYTVNGKLDERRTAELSFGDLVLMIAVAADIGAFDDTEIEMMQAALTKALMQNQIHKLMYDQHLSECDECREEAEEAERVANSAESPGEAKKATEVEGAKAEKISKKNRNINPSKLH